MSDENAKDHEQSGGDTGADHTEATIRHLVDRYGLTQNEAREIARKHGADTEAAEAAAARHRMIEG